MATKMEKLATELADDPTGQGFVGMTDREVRISLRTRNRPRNRSSMTGSEVLQAIDQTEYNGKTDAERIRIWRVLHLGELNPFGIEADVLLQIFGAGSDTIQALAAARVELISWLEESGFGPLALSDIAKARS